MKIKTSDLTGAALDWAVAKAGQPIYSDKSLIVSVQGGHDGIDPFTPSRNWDQGGPFIERENITLIRADDDYEVDAKGFTTNKRIPTWFAECSRWTGHTPACSYEGEYMEPTFMVGAEDGYYGPTPLIAAMRCYVASKLGETVDVPDELAGGAA